MVEGTHAEPESHCCGASMQKFSVGYDDLDELISNPPKYLTFRIELIDALSPNSYERETWTMSEDEKLSRILFLKESGNEDFRNNKLDKATDKYYEAVALLDQLLLKEKPGSKEHDKLSGWSIFRPFILIKPYLKLTFPSWGAVNHYSAPLFKRT